MREMAELSDRIRGLCDRAALGALDPQLHAEIEDVLAQGYLFALRGDSLSRQLQRRADSLAGSPDAAHCLEDMRRIRDATRALRSDLEDMRARWATLRESPA
jgi:hypothetical protein